MALGDVMLQNNLAFRFKLLLYLTGIELLLSGAITAFFSGRQGLKTTLAVSVFAIIAGVFGIFTPIFFKHGGNLEKRVMDIFKGMIGQPFPFIVILLLSIFFLVITPGIYITLLLAPLLICAWLIGLEILLLFGPPQTNEKDESSEIIGSKGKIYGILSVILAYGFLLLPSRIPTWLDGFPLESPAEFLFGTFTLPLTFIFGWRIFTKRFFVFSLVSLLVVKLIFFTILPQAGLGIYAFSSEEAFSANKWERSYYTFSTPGYTQVINHPYYGLREFPIEWINKRFGFDNNQFWLKLELSGYINLHMDEKLVFIVQGARKIQAELLDINTRETVPIVFIDRIEDANSKLYKSIPVIREGKIQGTLLYDIYGTMRLEPILLYPDGSTNSLFESARVWPSLEGVNYPISQSNAFVVLLNALNLLFAGLILTGLSIGVRILWKYRIISLVDLYLALSSLPIFFVTLLIHKQYINIWGGAIICVFYLVKFIELSLYKRHFSGKVFLFSMGIAVLSLLIAVNMNELRMVNSFPMFHDGHEYQIFAHNIFINQDTFLVNTPPRAYKVLFPYIVGTLHILFGQSVAAQLFFYAWCAVLSSVIIIELMKEIHLSAKASLGVATFYLLFLFLPSLYVFYFHFGLIEPFSTVFLLLTYYFAIKHKLFAMFLSGIFTILLRLDYLGITFTAIILTSAPMLGSQKAAWVQLFGWLRMNWKLLIAYLAALCTPVLLIVLGYFLFTPNYMLNAADTDQTSFTSVIEGMIRVIAGGTIKDLHEKFMQSPVDMLLVSTPLLIGFSLILASVFLRTGIFKKLDLRLGLLALSLLPAYIVVRPTVYLPRFSLPLLPLDLIIISIFVYQLWLQSHSIDNNG